MGYEIRELTLPSVLKAQAARRPGKTFVRLASDGSRHSYAQVHERSNRIAHGLLRRGLCRGECVAVMLENSLDHLLLLFAIAKCGAVAVPVNAAARGDLLRHYLTLSDAAMLVIDEELLPRAVPLRADLPLLRQVIAMPLGDCLPDGADACFAELVSEEAGDPDVEVSFRDLAMLAFTSGTTGPSKASCYSHAAVLQGAIACAEAWGYREDDVYYVCLPFFHMNALRASTYIALVLGATVALAKRFSASNFWNEVCATEATTFNLLGSMLNIVWTQPPNPREREHRVRMCRSAPMPAFAREFEQRFGLRLVTTYGVSDFGTPVAFTLDEPPQKLGATGKAQKGWHVRIVDDDDFDRPAGQTGEIVLRSEHMWGESSGYYKMPEATLEAMRNGWFHTGDLGCLDADGYLWFVGRKKDAIRRRGENVSAWEVEQALQKHPAVAEAAVYAVPSEMSEDEVAASVQLKPGAALTAAELVHFCAERMAYFMVPRFIEFVADFPRTGSQKIEKFRLREAAVLDRARLWDREAAGIKLAR